MISQRTIDETVRRLSAGESFLAIAKDMKIKSNILYYAFRGATGKSVLDIKPLKKRVPRRKKWSDVSQGIIDEAVWKLEAGGYFTDIAKNIEIDYDTLYMALKKATGKSVKEIKSQFANPRERYQKAMELLDNGRSISETAREIGVSRQAVSLWLKKRGSESFLSAKQLAQAKARELVRAKELTQSEISEKTGVCRSIVLEIAQDENIKLPRRARSPHPAYAAAAQDLQAGMQYQDVAKKYGLSLSCSYKWAVKNGMHKKTKGIERIKTSVNPGKGQHYVNV